MECENKLEFENLKSIDVLHFDRSAGQKCKFPKTRENFIEILRKMEKSLDNVPKNFCKKDQVKLHIVLTARGRIPLLKYKYI
jgi:hypothetical protein